RYGDSRRGRRPAVRSLGDDQSCWTWQRPRPRHRPGRRASPWRLDFRVEPDGGGPVRHRPPCRQLREERILAVPRILVVDDDADTCTFLEELLEAPDREFVSAQDPDSALMKIRTNTFDLLISDINLNAPRSGLDLLRRFRADQDAPVLLISGFGTLETAIEAVRAGAFDYISKPFVIADVKRVVERALAQGAH